MKKPFFLAALLSCALLSANPPAEERREAGYFFDGPRTFYPTASHVIAEISPYTDTIKLEDGSIWHTDPSDRNKLFSWLPSDLIVITQGSGWFSSYTFLIVNKTSNSSVAANISLGPILGGAYTHKAFLIDPISGQLILENGSRWHISYSDQAAFCQWLLNDTIIIGVNSSWFSSAEFILYDVEMNSVVKANLVQ
jgi:hypothetical protein